MRIRLSVAILLCSSLVLVSCGEREVEHDPASVPSILFVGKTFSNPYFVELATGVSNAARESGISSTNRSAAEENDVRGQLALIRNYLASNSQRRRAIILAPASSGSDFNQVIMEANRQLIPVVIVDTAIDAQAIEPSGARILTTIASDNFGGARAAGELVAARSRQCGAVLLLVGVPQQATAIARRDGFEVGLREGGERRGCNFQVLRRIGNWNRDEARRVVSALIPTGRRIVGVFGSNDQMALGASEAFEQAPRRIMRPVIVGFDAVPEAVEAVRNGRLDATMRQQPALMGDRAVAAIKVAWRGGSVRSSLDTPVQPVTRETLAR